MQTWNLLIPLFTLGMHNTNGSSDTEVWSHIAIAHDCMLKQLECYLWKSSIFIHTKVCLYRVYILPFCWTVMTSGQSPNNSQIGYMHFTCSASYTCHLTNAQVRSVTAASCFQAGAHEKTSALRPSGQKTKWRRSSQSTGSHNEQPAHRQRIPRGYPQDIWIRTVSHDVQPFNISIHSAWHRAADSQQWHELVNTAMLQ